MVQTKPSKAMILEALTAGNGEQQCDPFQKFISKSLWIVQVGGKKTHLGTMGMSNFQAENFSVWTESSKVERECGPFLWSMVVSKCSWLHCEHHWGSVGIGNQGEPERRETESNCPEREDWGKKLIDLVQWCWRWRSRALWSQTEDGCCLRKRMMRGMCTRWKRKWGEGQWKRHYQWKCVGAQGWQKTVVTLKTFCGSLCLWAFIDYVSTVTCELRMPIVAWSSDTWQRLD